VLLLFAEESKTLPLRSCESSETVNQVTFDAAETLQASVLQESSNDSGAKLTGGRWESREGRKAV
jgi:hypothetical protein